MWYSRRKSVKIPVIEQTLFKALHRFSIAALAEDRLSFYFDVTALPYQDLQAICTEYSPREASPKSVDAQRRPPTPAQGSARRYPASEPPFLPWSVSLTEWGCIGSQLVSRERRRSKARLTSHNAHRSIVPSVFRLLCLGR